MTLKYYPELYGCVARDGYGYGDTRTPFTTDPRLKGRSRKTLRDTHPTYALKLNITMSDEQFAGWQSFWANINYGVDPFRIDLVVTKDPGELTVQAAGPFNASYTAAGFWDVSVPVEALV